MSRPLQDSEREEIENLAFECESPATLRRYLFELIRLRNVMRVVRSRSRMNPSVERVIAENLPSRMTTIEWYRLTGIGVNPDLAANSEPHVLFQPDFELTPDEVKR